MAYDREDHRRADPKIIDHKVLIDYKDVDHLSRFIGPQGQILSRRRTGFSAQRQKQMKKAIKRARHLGLLIFVG